MCKHHLRSVTAILTHTESGGLHLGIASLLSSHLRCCMCQVSLPCEQCSFIQEETASKKKKPTRVGFKIGQCHVLFPSCKNVPVPTPVFVYEHTCTCLWEHSAQKAAAPTPCFTRREAQRMTPARRLAEVISLANSAFAAIPNEESHEYQ